MHRILCSIALMLPLLAGCAATSVQDYAGRTPELRMEDYFLGHTRGWGVFHDRSGLVRRMFTVDIHGYMEAGQLILDEHFLYDDGETQQRVWRIDLLADGRYQGRADDIAGAASGQVAGNALNWTYLYDLEADGRTWRVRFDDWMFLHQDGMLINRAAVTWYGFKAGELTLVFQRRPDGV